MVKHVTACSARKLGQGSEERFCASLDRVVRLPFDVGAHVWVFFTDRIPAATARAVGTVLVHEAMILRGSLDLRSYGRLFPKQDVLPEGGLTELVRVSHAIAEIANMTPDAHQAYVGSSAR